MSVFKKLKTSTGRIILSSAFSNRMLNGDVALVYKSDITVDDAKALVSLAESANDITFENTLNPRHTSTCILAQGLTQSTPTGAMISLDEGDVVVVMQPSSASRDDTEFDVRHFEACDFMLLQRLPLSMLGGEHS
jgi:hypothetical protein